MDKYRAALGLLVRSSRTAFSYCTNVIGAGSFVSDSRSNLLTVFWAALHSGNSDRFTLCSPLCTAAGPERAGHGGVPLPSSLAPLARVSANDLQNGRRDAGVQQLCRHVLQAAEAADVVQAYWQRGALPRCSVHVWGFLAVDVPAAWADCRTPGRAAVLV
eukprot:gene4855-biopygen9854